MFQSRSQENICCLFMVAYLLFIPGGKPLSQGRNRSKNLFIDSVITPLKPYDVFPNSSVCLTSTTVLPL